MAIEIKEKGIFVILNEASGLDQIEEVIQSVFTYKRHRYIHIAYFAPLLYADTFFTFFSRIKNLPIILIFEAFIPRDINTVHKLYAAGVDIAVFWVDDDTDTALIKEVKEVFSNSSLILKKKAKQPPEAGSSEFIQNIPILATDSIFEKIIRKFWIDISNLKRKLKVTEVADSYDASGL